eukprot:CAMPEP_0185771272 /NCGR_PEP_ID=MMETSP1174-20130828/63946_1 /TAXON_ID=35687 /ORGANISM="Dictyocha speculum, Strain CCMP1381" /LENGTH=67 /DNA_ID=CAMNT_0028457077 /DNA_START=174 /DNA_END=373 /DNA_ORIENTATION=+
MLDPERFQRDLKQRTKPLFNEVWSLVANEVAAELDLEERQQSKDPLASPPLRPKKKKTHRQKKMSPP